MHAQIFFRALRVDRTPAYHTDWNWRFAGKILFQCCKTIIGYSRVVLALLGVLWHQKIIKSSKKATQRPEKAKSKMTTIAICCATIIGHSCVSLALMGVNLPQKTCKSLKRMLKAEKGQVKNDCYNSFMTLILFVENLIQL